MAQDISIQFTRFPAFHSPLIATIACGFLEKEGLKPRHSVHTLHVVRYALRCAPIVEDMDPQLDDPEKVKAWFAQGGKAAPPKFRLQWALCHLDLGLVDDATKSFFVLQRGRN